MVPRPLSLVPLLCLVAGPALPLLAQEKETPNFSLLGHLGAGTVSGFLGTGNPAPSGGLWLGIGITDRLDGLWGLDYFTMPSQEITVPLIPSSKDPATSKNVLPTDDLSITIDLRWYLGPKFDGIHGRFNTVPYLIAGAGMDLVVDQYPPPLNSNFYSKSFDGLLAFNAGAGLDMPLGDGGQWLLYGEALDHLIAWQGLTQVYLGRIGVKVMLDSAHVDPFRGVF